MLSWPKNDEQVIWARQFLVSRGAAYVSPSAHFIFWSVDGYPTWVVAFDDWVGKTCQMHVANSKCRIVPRELARAVFRYAFWSLGREMVFAMVNGRNKAALRLDRWLGFTDLIIIPGMHDDGGDLVVLKMPKSDCRWLETKLEQIDTAAS